MAKNKKISKEQKNYQHLQEYYREMNGYFLDFIWEHAHEDTETELSAYVKFDSIL